MIDSSWPHRRILIRRLGTVQNGSFPSQSSMLQILVLLIAMQANAMPVTQVAVQPAAAPLPVAPASPGMSTRTKVIIGSGIAAGVLAPLAYKQLFSGDAKVDK